MNLETRDVGYKDTSLVKKNKRKRERVTKRMEINVYGISEVRKRRRPLESQCIRDMWFEDAI